MTEIVWAKKSSGHYYPLVAHSVDVAAVIHQLVTSTVIGHRFQTLTGQSRADLAEAAGYMAMLHDMGKAQTGFRHQLGGGHVSPAVALLQAATTNSAAQKIVVGHFKAPMQTYARWFGDRSAFDWMLTTFGHHGKPVRSQKLRAERWDETACAGLDQLCKAAEALYDQPDLSIESTEAQHYFNGLLTLADWIASDEQFFPYVEIDNMLSTDLEVIEPRARKQADRALRRIGLLVPRANKGVRSLIPDPYEPYSIQLDIEELPTHAGSCAVLESATGSGKTEAALARFAQLQKAGAVDSLYFAVPTRAAATQLYDRVTKAKEELFDEPPQSVLAVPGYLKVDGYEGWTYDRETYWRTNGRYERDDSDLRMRGWAAESSKRYTAAPIAVGTVDQAMQAVVKNKHSHMRLAGLSRSLLVVDEVHSSSTYMEELLLRLVQIMKDAGGHVLLMSATIAAESLARYAQIYDPTVEVPSLKTAQEKAYPSIAYLSGEEQSFDGYKMPGEDKQVTVRTNLDIKDPVAIAKAASSHAKRGAKVLVIRNTVSSACETFTAIDSGVRKFSIKNIPTAHHSRYVRDDRVLLDREIEAEYGKHSSRGDGLVTVATQTVEQSLDIDADVLITDICPMDVLLQRIGRLHRHDRSNRPKGYHQPLCTVASLQNEYTSLINTEKDTVFGPSGIGTVYQDLRMLQSTQRIAEREDVFVIPRDNRVLVEAALHSDSFSSGGVWKHHKEVLKSKGQYSKVQARQGMITYNTSYMDDKNQFPTAFIPTRLGDEDVLITLPQTVQTPYGNRIDEINIRFYDAQKADILDEDTDEVPNAQWVRQNDSGFVFKIGGLEMQYDTLGLSAVPDQ